ncbi:MAG: hypothetical protein AB7V58_03470 [Solirubrobacterales bacterium]
MAAAELQRTMRGGALPVLVAAAAMAAGGCGGAEAGGAGAEDRSTGAATAIARSEPAAAKAPAPASAARPRGTRVEVVDSRFGPLVADRHGEALYLFERERGGRSKCYGPCAGVWPPLLTRGRPVAAGVEAGLLGTTRRADGKLQVTYAGHPLYRYVGDSPGTILCHDVVEFGGTWLVVRPDGQPAA